MDPERGVHWRAESETEIVASFAVAPEQVELRLAIDADFTLPSRVTVGWWFGTPRYEPFFDATILSAEAIG